MKPTTAEALRKRELAAIHVAKKELAMDDAEYKSILLAVTGQSSAADLDWQGRKKLLDHFKAAGFKRKASKAGRPRPTVVVNRQAQIGKIEALLADAGRAWAYADSIAKRVCKIDRIEFCRGEHLAKIIAALVYDAKRRARAAQSVKPAHCESEHGA